MDVITTDGRHNLTFVTYLPVHMCHGSGWAVQCRRQGQGDQGIMTIVPSGCVVVYCNDV